MPPTRFNARVTIDGKEYDAVIQLVWPGHSGEASAPSAEMPESLPTFDEGDEEGTHG